MDGVSEVAVDMDVKVVSVTYDASLTEVAALEKAITGAGYQANQAAADSAVYAKLPDCCKVPQTPIGASGAAVCMSGQHSGRYSGPPLATCGYQ